jgi:L-histidine N-alpha-methyltransferase
VSDPRLTFVDAGGAERGDFAADLAAGLGAAPKHLPCRWFYDAAGSALFEAICDLPEYYLTRAEAEILAAHAGEIARLAPARTLVELGSGSAVKTRLLLERYLDAGPCRYVPIDVAEETLTSSARARAHEHPALAVTAIRGEYRAGLAALPPGDGARLLLFLGSNIGNFDRADAARFLGDVRACMRAGDRLLLGVDLRKERAVLERAYDDPRGVTAAFNKNLLARANRELGARFALEAFAHRARYDEAAGRIDMWLVSTRAQEVEVGALGRRFAFAAGEAVHTECSYKYAPEEIDALAAAAGLRLAERWLDGGARFALSLLTLDA